MSHAIPAPSASARPGPFRIPRTPRCAPAAACALLATLAAPASADPLALGRWTVDGGGSAYVSSGTFVLAGTVGQPDAGLQEAGDFVLIGGFWVPGNPPTTGVGGPPGREPGKNPESLPVVAQIHAAAPNPARLGVSLAFDLPEERPVAIHVFDVTGARVRTVLDTRMPAGRHRSTWDVADDAGRHAGPGLYFVRVRLGPLARTMKLIVLQ